MSPSFNSICSSLIGCATIATSSKALGAGLYTIYHPLLDLRAHPRTRTTLTVQSLNSAQPASQPLYVSSRAAAINASTLAILNAGSIGMKGVPVAVGIASVPTHGKGKQRAYDDVEEDQQMEEVSYEDKDVTLVLDPTRNEEQKASARFCFGWAFGSEFSSGRRTGGKGAEQENQDEDAECIYVESDGEFDTVTVSPRQRSSARTLDYLLIPGHNSFKKPSAHPGLHVRL